MDELNITEQELPETTEISEMTEVPESPAVPETPDDIDVTKPLVPRPKRRKSKQQIFKEKVT